MAPHICLKGGIMAKILIVDDEKDIVEIAKIMLERAGHKVDFARGGRSCLEKLKNSDIII